MICSSIWCGNDRDSSCKPLVSGAAEGTTCDSQKVKFIKSLYKTWLQLFHSKKKICIKNKCVKSVLAPKKTSCNFSDGLMFKEYIGERFEIPYSPMSCESFLEYSYANLIHNDNSGCLNPYIKEQCCNACKSN